MHTYVLVRSQARQAVGFLLPFYWHIFTQTSLTRWALQTASRQHLIYKSSQTLRHTPLSKRFRDTTLPHGTGRWTNLLVSTATRSDDACTRPLGWAVVQDITTSLRRDRLRSFTRLRESPPGESRTLEEAFKLSSALLMLLGAPVWVELLPPSSDC